MAVLELPRTDLQATMAAGGLGSYHRPYPGGAQTKHIGDIPTPWAMPDAPGLVTIHRMGEWYYYHQQHQNVRLMMHAF
jgi:hypothetical protein